jgi:type IV pilus assembly protein PilY1
VTTQNPLGANSGWYLDLVSPSPTAGFGTQGEKQVTNPIVRDGKVVFTTLIPNANPCGAGGSSWLMELDMLSGGRLLTAPFDINNDGQFTAADMVVLPGGGGATVQISGVQWGTAGILQSPGVIEGETGQGVCVQYKYMPDSGGNIQRVNENCGPGGLGRQSWRQIR